MDMYPKSDFIELVSIHIVHRVVHSDDSDIARFGHPHCLQIVHVAFWMEAPRRSHIDIATRVAADGLGVLPAHGLRARIRLGQVSDRDPPPTLSFFVFWIGSGLGHI